MTIAKRPVGRPRKDPVEPHHAGVAEATELARMMAAPAPPQGVRVLLRKRFRGGDGPEIVEEEAVWPHGWPLPSQGCVVLGREIGGWCEHTEMDLPNGRVVIVLRAA